VEVNTSVSCEVRTSYTYKSEAIPVTSGGSLYVCEMLRIPQCLDSQLVDDNKVVSLMHRPPLYFSEILFLSFCHPGSSARPEGLFKLI
jgi:hypothetical protein